MEPVHPQRDIFSLTPSRGEMRERISAFSWSSTALGPIEGWSPSLQSALSICLDSSFPFVLYGGPDLIVLYNDACSGFAGQRHPWVMGRPAREAWADIWDILGPDFDESFTGGQAIRREDQLLPVSRYGYTEECYFSYTLSPIRGVGGRIDGLFGTVVETTGRVTGERRLRTLRDLAAAPAEQICTVNHACEIAAGVLAENPYDLPLALLYLFDAPSGEVTLAGSAGVRCGTPVSPARIDLNHPDAPWPFAEVLQTRRSVEVRDLSGRFGPLVMGRWPEPIQQAVVLPMAKPGQSPLAGFVVLGVSPRRLLDDDYRGFFDLVASQIATGVANAHAYEEERQRAEALADLDRAKNHFFDNISHEFRTPLTLMLSPVEDLLRQPAGEAGRENREVLSVVDRNARRLLRLVNTLLDFSRIETGRMLAVYQPTALAAFTRDLCSGFRAVCERANLRLVVDCPTLSEPIYVDRDMWEKIVLNLLSNAFKFTFEGEIAVSLTEADQAVQLRVGDMGTGIPAEEIPHLFERFHRIDNAHSRTHEGSGIGLALVQELVKLHRGSISVESAVDRGTTFTVTIPTGSAHLPSERIRDSQAAASVSSDVDCFAAQSLRWVPDGPAMANASDDGLRQAAQADRPRVMREGQDRPRVLIADDNAELRQYLHQLLGDRYEVMTASDGEQTLAAARHWKPDLILADVMMPRLDGFELLRALRADPATAALPFIMLSARAGEQSRVQGIEAGADDYLVKPFSARELIARVGATLQLAHLRRQGNEILRQGEQRLQMALGAARMVAWEWDLANDTVNVSENAAELFGLPSGSTIESNDQRFALIHREDVERHRATVDQTVQQCGSYLSQFRMMRGDTGAVIWLEERGDAVCDAAGRVLRLVGVVMDITERKRAEALLAGQNRVLEMLAAGAPLGDVLSAIVQMAQDQLTDSICAVVLPDEQGNHVEQSIAPGLSAACLQTLAGVPIGTPLLGPCGMALHCGQPVSVSDVKADDRWHPQWREMFLNQGLRSCHSTPVLDSSGKALAVFDIYLRRNGGVDPISQQLIQIATHLAGVAIERKATERTLQQSHARFESLVDNAPLALCLVDADLRIRQVNAKASAAFGDIQGLVGSDFAELMHALWPQEYASEIVEVFRRTLDTGQPHFIPERMERRLDRPLMEYYEWQTHRISLPGGQCGVVCYCNNVSRHVLARQALAENDRRKDEFLATLAHELRNPLAPIRTGLELIRMAAGDLEMVEEVRGKMEAQTRQLVRLVDDLLDVSRITSGKVALRKECVDLASVVQSAVEATRSLYEASGHELCITMPSQPIYLDGDATRLAQIVSNLLSNAARYTEDCGHVSLVVQRQGAEALVTVSDDGIGIPADMLENIFGMFTQVDRSLERSHSGLGIGLTLVKRLAEMHGGSVQARSDGPGKGSEFCVRLPILSEPQPARVASDQTPVPSIRLRILVVDDNKDAARMLGTVVELLGNEVRVAFDGQEALDMVAGFQPDVVLMDLGMPKLNGYDAARQMRAQCSGKLTLVAITGWGQEEDRRRTLDAGFDHHIVKPVEPAALQDLLASCQPRTF